MKDNFFLKTQNLFVQNWDLDSIEIYRVGEGEDVAGKANSAFL